MSKSEDAALAAKRALNVKNQQKHRYALAMRLRGVEEAVERLMATNARLVAAIEALTAEDKKGRRASRAA